MTWIIPKSLRSEFAQASACSMSDCMPDSTTSEDQPALWVTSNGTPTLRPFSYRGWQKKPWSQRLFGPETYRMSDGNAGLDAWTASLRASRANRTAWPETAPEPMTTAGRGLTSLTAFAWLDPASRSWKTSPACDLLGDWMPYSQTWPRSGSLQNGTVSALETWVPATSASEFSFWPTATVYGNNNRAGSSPTAGDGLQTAAKQWHPPTTPKGGGKTRGGNRSAELLLAGQAASWQTPTAADGIKGGPNNRHSDGILKLSGQAARFWPTPASRDQKGENSADHLQNGTGRLHLDQLPNFVKFCWTTPAASDSTRGGAADLAHDRPNAGANGELPLFAPGPDASEWADVIDRFPYLAPATESGVRVLADGLAVVVDESRADQLRCVGNGVVALQAAVAFVVLARRAGIV